METVKKKSISDWAEEDRPREKLLLRGKNSLTDAELIAILIGSGNNEQSAVDLSQVILSHFGNNLNELAKATVNDLIKFKGIGEAKAVSIVSALELGRRRKESHSLEKPVIESARECYEYFKPYLLDIPHEEFWILLLDRAHRIIKPVQISKGGVGGTFVDVQIILKAAIEHLATFILMVHNHPSGALKASDADIAITRKVKQAAKLIDITLDEHLIFTNEGYYSMAEKGLI